MFIFIKQGESPLEEAAIQAHLQRLGLDMNENRELIELEGAVPEETLIDLETIAGTKPQLDLADLACVGQEQPNISLFMKRLLGKDEPTIAHSTFKATRRSLAGATQSLLRINNSGEVVDESRFQPLGKQMKELVKNLERAFTPAVLRHIHPEDLNEVERELDAFVEQFERAELHLSSVGSKHVSAQCLEATSLSSVHHER